MLGGCSVSEMNLLGPRSIDVSIESIKASRLSRDEFMVECAAAADPSSLLAYSTGTGGSGQPTYFQVPDTESDKPANEVTLQTTWKRIIRGCMQLVDDACDTYLQDFYKFHRRYNRARAGISLARGVTTAFAQVFDASNTVINSIAVLFGFGEDAFDIYQDALLVALGYNQVYSLVKQNQLAVRIKLESASNLDKSDAVSIVRSYISLCQPFVIDTLIADSANSGVVAAALGDMNNVTKTTNRVLPSSGSSANLAAGFISSSK
jgi:hypothetical protein